VRLELDANLIPACWVHARIDRSSGRRLLCEGLAITFLALPRGAESRNAHEAPRPMLIGMGCLTFACLALGLGATWFLPVFGGMTEQLLGQRVGGDLITGNGWVLSGGVPHGGTVSTAMIAIGLLILAGAAVLLVRVAGRKFARQRGPTWDCGLPGLTEENEYTATAFSKPLRMIFSVLYQPRREIQQVSTCLRIFPRDPFRKRN